MSTEEQISIKGKFVFSLEFHLETPIMCGSKVVVRIIPGGPVRGGMNQR